MKLLEFRDIEDALDTAVQWVRYFGGKEYLRKHNIPDNYGGVWFKKALENGDINIKELDRVTKGQHGQTGGIPFSQTAVWKNYIKPHLDKLTQEKVNNMPHQMDEESSTGSIGVGAGPIMTPKAFSKKRQKTNKATQTAMKQGFKKLSGMPKNSKILDYKELWKGKKSSMNENLINLIKKELLNEVSYNKFKNEVKYRTKSEMLHKSIREVKRKLEEVEKLVEYTTRIKQELSENEEGVGYWKRSLKAINEISEVSNKISNKIKSIYQ
jgi:hypothetical protein